MKIQTTRFGELEVDNNDIITFKEGLLGFDHLNKFFIVDPGDQTLILWVQSVDDGTIAFPIIEPKIFKQDYSVRLLPSELESLELESINEASIYTILTIPQDVTDMSANLKAPLVINNQARLARQIVLQDNKLEVQYSMYKDLKRYIVNYASDDSMRTTADKLNTEPTVQKMGGSEEETKTEKTPSNNQSNEADA